MAQERKAKPMGAFFKFTEIGQSVAGKIAEFKNGADNVFMIIDSPVLRSSKKEKPVQYLTAAVGLATDIATKIDRRKDAGKYFYIEYNDTEPTTKGSPKKLFKVLEITPQEFHSLEQMSERRTSDPYTTHNTAIDDDKPEVTDNAQDDLPF